MVAAENPLVIVVIVEPDDIEQLLLAAELRPEAPEIMSKAWNCASRAPSASSRVMRPLRVGGDVDRRFAMHEARTRIDREDFMHRRDGCARELNLQFETAPARIRIETSGIAATPGMERYLVDRAVEGDASVSSRTTLAAAAANRAKRSTKAGDQMSRSSGQP